MILELKQVATGFLSRYELIDLTNPRRKVPFGFVTMIPYRTQLREASMNIRDHGYHVLPTDSTETVFEVAMGNRGTEDVGEFSPSEGALSEVAGHRQLAYQTIHSIYWRGDTYQLIETPMAGDGLYYQIRDGAGDTVAIIERGTTIVQERECFIASIERDGAVAMVASAMAYMCLAMIARARDAVIPRYTLELPEHCEFSLDTAFLERVRSARG